MSLKKFKIWAQENPHLLDTAYQCSLEEAGRLVGKEGILPFEEMVRAARVKSGLPEETWQAVAASIAKNAQKQTAKRRITLGMAPRQFRFAVSVFVIVLFAGYFTLHPSGKALAAKVFDMVFVEDRSGDQTRYWIQNQHTSPDVIIAPPNSKESVNTREDIVKSYESLEDFENEYGLTPARLNGNSDIKFHMIELQDSVYSGIITWCDYFNKNNEKIVLMQRWNNPSTITYATGNSEYFEDSFGTKYLWHCFIDDKDGSFSGTTILEDSILDVYCVKGVDYTEIFQYLDINKE